MTKLEQVALAIADALNMEQSPHMYEPEDTLRAARAAVEALREPSVAQIAAGWEMLRREKPPVKLLGTGPGLKEAYDATLDAILSEKPE